MSPHGANGNGSNAGRRPHDDDYDDGGSDKGKKPLGRGGSLTQIANSPAAPPPGLPLLIPRALGRRRRRSDFLLLLIGISICVLSVTHIAWHSGDLPHTRHVNWIRDPPDVKMRGKKSALHHKLDSFVKERKESMWRIKRASKLALDAKNNTGSIQTGDANHRNEVAGNMAKMDTAGAKSGGLSKVPKEAKQNVESTVAEVVEHTTEAVKPPNNNNATASSTGVGASKKKNDDTQSSQTEQDSIVSSDPHPVAHLNCADHGGPSNQQIVDEMVFWSDIPSDSSYLSPMHPLNDPHTPSSTERYLTFEPDSGGWNNIRMAMETALVMSHAMGRTLVLPPEQRMYLIDKPGKDGQQHAFGFYDFFHLDAISIEHRGFKVITMEEFLIRVGMRGELKDDKTQQVSLPPGNQTKWGGGSKHDLGPLWRYLRSAGNTPSWDAWECALAIPSSTEPESITELNNTLHAIMDGSYGKSRPTLEEFNGNPTPVNASLAERMREMLADRDKLCIYDKPLQESKLVHLKVDGKVRYLTHFYAFIFFADWRQDLWSKRFVRDHLRYVDEIMCAAARVVEAVRKHARTNKIYNISRDEGIYDAMHVRRGDFQFPPTQLPAEKLHDLSKGEMSEGATLYIATDERNKAFFDIFKQHYDVVFLDDFLHVIPDINSNFYGMIDQLVAYKSRIFYGTWWSTLSGYVNRMRGYYISKHKLEGYQDGTMKSWYFTPEERVLQMRSYIPVRKPIYCREFPTSWRDIDKGIEEIAELSPL